MTHSHKPEHFSAATFGQAIPEQPDYTEGLAELTETALWYTDTQGTGEAIVLLHPASGSGLIWGHQRPAFVNAGYRVITYSRRGFPNSALVANNKTGVASEDLRELADFLGLEKFHAVASAAGGDTAADFAISYPDRLLSLVVAGNALGIAGGEIRETANRVRPKEWSLLPAWFRELGPSYRAGNPKGTRHWIDLESMVPQWDDVKPHFAREITTEMLATLPMPILLMTGDCDMSTPAALMRRIGELIGPKRVAIVPEAGHSIYWERPEVFNDEVMSFIKSIDQ